MITKLINNMIKDYMITYIIIYIYIYIERERERYNINEYITN